MEKTETEKQLSLLQVKKYIEEKAEELEMNEEDLVNELFPVKKQDTPLEEILQFIRECLVENAFHWPEDGYESVRSIVAWTVICLSASFFASAWLLMSHLFTEVFH